MPETKSPVLTARNPHEAFKRSFLTEKGGNSKRHINIQKLNIKIGLKGLPEDVSKTKLLPVPTVFLKRSKNKHEGAENAYEYSSGNIKDRTTPGMNIIQTLFASIPPKA